MLWSRKLNFVNTMIHCAVKTPDSFDKTGEGVQVN